MDWDEAGLGEKSRLAVLLDALGEVPDPRDPWRVALPLQEILFLVVCGTICDCDDYENIAEWGAAHLDFLRGYLPYERGIPGSRWLTILMNRIDPVLFSEAFTAWVRATWPGQADFIAIDGKTSRRSRDSVRELAPLHLVSAFATTRKLVLAQEAVPEKRNELSAIPVLLQRLAASAPGNTGLAGALISIDAIATNPIIADAVTAVGADYLLAVKANQATLRAGVEAVFAQADRPDLDATTPAPAPDTPSHTQTDKGHGRIEERRVRVAHDTDWLEGPRRFPGEMRLPGARTLIEVRARTQLHSHSRWETRYYISSAHLTAQQAQEAVRGHWGIENSLHWVLDVTFKEDQSRLRRGHGARNMALIRHFALNLVRHAPLKGSIKTRRKAAGWNAQTLNTILGSTLH